METQKLNTGFWFTCGGYCWMATDTAWMCPTCIHVKATTANNNIANSKHKLIFTAALLSDAIYEVAKIIHVQLTFTVAMTEAKYTTASKTCKF